MEHSDDDEGYFSSDSRDSTAQEVSERRNNYDDNALNVEMLKRRLQHFELSDPDTTHATVIIIDRLSRLIAGHFKDCPDNSGEFEFTEYMDENDVGARDPFDRVLFGTVGTSITQHHLKKLYSLLRPGGTIDVQVAVPDPNRAALSGSQTNRPLSRVDCDEVDKVKRMMQEVGLENTRYIDAWYPDEPELAREIATGEIHGWDGVVGQEAQGSYEMLTHFGLWKDVEDVSLYTIRGRRPKTNNKRSRDELDKDSWVRKRVRLLEDWDSEGPKR